MAEAVEPVRKAEWAPAAPTTRTRAPDVTPVPFDLATPERPALDPRANAALARLSLALPVAPAGDDAREVAAPHAPTLRFNHADPHAIRDAAQDALREAADARNFSPARLAESAPTIAPDRAPSRNHAGSEATITHALLARDETGALLTLDLHLARLGPSLWEAAAFDHAGAAVAGFPYSGDPLDVTRLYFDPRAGAFALPEPHRGLQVFSPRDASAMPGRDMPARDMPGRAAPHRVAWPFLAGCALLATILLFGTRP